MNESHSGKPSWSYVNHVAKMTFYVPDLALRDVINGIWAEHYPDPASRPARHTQLSPGATISCDFLAYITD